MWLINRKFCVKEEIVHKLQRSCWKCAVMNFP